MSRNPFHKTIKPLRTFTHTKTGKAKRGLWINNLTLKRTFEAGEAIRVIYDEENKIVVIQKATKDATNRISYRKNDEQRKPILDIKNNTIDRMFEGIRNVEIQFFKDKIIVQMAYTDEQRIKRENKSDFLQFDLFSGGGTASSHLSKSGWRVAGGVDTNEQYISMFEENHKGCKYTILGSVNDISPRDYPRNMMLVNVGFPCLPYSGSNLRVQKALANKKEGKETEDDLKYIKNREDSDHMAYFVVEALRTMNPKFILLEQVPEFIDSNAYSLIKAVLTGMGYELSEIVSESSHTKRPRLAMVFSSVGKVNLDNLFEDDNKTIEDFLETPVHLRDWKPKEDIPRILGASKKKNVGIRAVRPTDKKAHTFTTHSTRHTECSLVIEGKDGTPLYSEFTNQEIANLHMLPDYKLSEEVYKTSKTIKKLKGKDNNESLDRQILGQGCADQFYFIGKRIMEHEIMCQNEELEKEELELVS